jgi:hypothetical protein
VDVASGWPGAWLPGLLGSLGVSWWLRPAGLVGGGWWVVSEIPTGALVRVLRVRCSCHVPTAELLGVTHLADTKGEDDTQPHP